MQFRGVTAYRFSVDFSLSLWLGSFMESKGEMDMTVMSSARRTKLSGMSGMVASDAGFSGSKYQLRFPRSELD